jgi:DNA invertase Pin-like site-specific DNA recombinase
MLGVFTEFEANLRREGQLEGIAKAKAAGVEKGWPQAQVEKAQGRWARRDGNCEAAKDRPRLGLSRRGSGKWVIERVFIRATRVEATRKRLIGIQKPRAEVAAGGKGPDIGPA